MSRIINIEHGGRLCGRLSKQISEFVVTAKQNKNGVEVFCHDSFFAIRAITRECLSRDSMIIITGSNETAKKLQVFIDSITEISSKNHNVKPKRVHIRTIYDEEPINDKLERLAGFTCPDGFVVVIDSNVKVSPSMKDVIYGVTYSDGGAIIALKDPSEFSQQVRIVSPWV